MRIVIDAHIPYLDGCFAWADVDFCAAEAITASRVREADALIVRTRTCCDEQLLSGSRVQFIATATAGFDHIDTDYCDKAGITWSNAAGCNANSVAEYVELAVRLLMQETKHPLSEQKIGIVGVGAVGSRVARRMEKLGMRTLLCDPPRAAKGENIFNNSLTELREQCDIITFHTPLIHRGDNPTFHLADEAFFTATDRPFTLINTARGGVVDDQALLRALDSTVRHAIIDVWESEPNIDRELIQRAFISTPHIAGYSADGKLNASRIVYEQIHSFFGKPTVPYPYKLDDISGAPSYSPLTDSMALKADPNMFEQLRNTYPVRREQTFI